MDKHELILRTSLVLNQLPRNEDDTSYFNDKKHDVLLREFRQYLLHNADYLGAIDVTSLQALNDHGVDILMKTANDIKIGFQIKSHFDVEETHFAANVKRQFAESLTYGLDKWYLIICCPIQAKSKNFEAKISHLINEINTYKTDYYSVISPKSAVPIFLNNVKRDETDFNQKLNLYNYKRIEPDLRKQIALEYSQYNIDSIISNTASQGKKHNNAAAFINFLRPDYEFEENDLITELDIFYKKLQFLSLKDRQFFYSCIVHCYEKGAILGQTSSVYVPVLRLQDEGFSRIDINQRVASLEVAKLFALDPDDNHEAGQEVAKLKSQTKIDELIIPYHIKEFIKDNYRLNEIISNLNFSILD